MKIPYAKIRVKYRPWELMDAFLADDQIHDIERNRILYDLVLAKGDHSYGYLRGFLDGRELKSGKRFPTQCLSFPLPF